MSHLHLYLQTKAVINYVLCFPPLSALWDVKANCCIVCSLLIGGPNSFFMWLPSLHWWNNFATSSPPQLCFLLALRRYGVFELVWTCLDLSCNFKRPVGFEPSAFSLFLCIGNLITVYNNDYFKSFRSLELAHAVSHWI